jgi:hypothetical protein
MHNVDCCTPAVAWPEKQAVKIIYIVKFFLLNIRKVITRAGIFKQSMGTRNRVGIGLSCRPARLHRLAEFIPWNLFLGSINV